LAIGFLG
jgi:hypothetical protein